MSRTKINEYDKAFIIANQDNLFVREMSKELDLLAETIRIFMREQGITTLYIKNKKVLSNPLSPKDILYIMDNHESMTCTEMAKAINNTCHSVNKFLKSKKQKAFKRTPIKIDVDPIEEKVRFERPPAVYSNISYHH